MEYFELVQKRFSVRSYLDQPVEAEKLNAILEAARQAPTACNLQAFKIVVIHTKDHQEALKKIYQRAFFIQAPIVIGIFSQSGAAWVRSDGKCYGDVDAAIVMDHLILSATDQGLGSCWVASFNAAAARELLGLGDEYEPVAFTPIGYPAGAAVKKTRKSLEDIVIDVP